MSEPVIICGFHAVKSALQVSPEKALTLWLDKNRKDKRLQILHDIANHSGIAIEYVSKTVLNAKAQRQTHQGVVLLSRAALKASESQLDDVLAHCGKMPLVLVLDGITDPHNLGACMRTADAAGVNLIIAPKDKAVGINATVRKAASGAAEVIPFIQVTNLSRTLRHLKDTGLWITGTSMQGISVYAADFAGPRAIVMGSEGRGMRRLTQEHCDELVYIPMQGQVESLNVSVATGVVLFQALRQRL